MTYNGENTLYVQWKNSQAMTFTYYSTFVVAGSVPAPYRLVDKWVFVVIGCAVNLNAYGLMVLRKSTDNIFNTSIGVSGMVLASYTSITGPTVASPFTVRST